MRKPSGLLLLAAGLSLLLLPLLACADSAPSVGSTAPDFTLNSQEGKPVKLSQFRGKWVVLYFYPKDMTSGCTLEAHNFQRDEEQYKAKNAVILGVSVDDTKSHQEFCTKEGLTFKLLADTDHKVSEEYGSLTNLGLVKFSDRHTFLIDPQGKIVKEYPDVDSEYQPAQRAGPRGTGGSRDNRPHARQLPPIPLPITLGLCYLPPRSGLTGPPVARKLAIPIFQTPVCDARHRLVVPPSQPPGTAPLSWTVPIR